VRSRALLIQFGRHEAQSSSLGYPDAERIKKGRLSNGKEKQRRTDDGSEEARCEGTGRERTSEVAQGWQAHHEYLTAHWFEVQE
jgi:hypothetical protein